MAPGEVLEDAFPAEARLSVFADRSGRICFPATAALCVAERINIAGREHHDAAIAEALSHDRGYYRVDRPSELRVRSRAEFPARHVQHIQARGKLRDLAAIQQVAGDRFS